MSKIGKKNIVIPKESSIKIEGGNLTITGPKGTKKLSINDKIFTSKLSEKEFEILRGYYLDNISKLSDKKDAQIEMIFYISTYFRLVLISRQKDRQHSF